jgi:glycosyltransferase involved in cell wall biosynthesis
MKILHLIYDHPSNPWVGGGGAVRAYELSRILAARGHHVTMVSGKHPGALDSEAGRLSVRFVGSEKSYARSTFSFAFEGARYIRKHSAEYDLVVEDFAAWNPLFSFLLSKRPVVMHINHREGLGILKRWNALGLPFYLIEAFYPRFFRHITALSEWTRRKVGLPQTVVLPAGISEEQLSACGGGGPDEGYLFYVGRLHLENKGLDTLVEALRVLKARGRGARLVMAGRGKDEARLRAMSAGLDVELAGFVDEKKKTELLSKCSLLVLPSRFEGWGIVVLEAAACGKPVVVSDIPELSFSVEAGYGLAFRKGAPGDLADKLSALLGDPALRAEMGRRARESVKEQTWEKIADFYERYLEGVLREEGRGGGR